MRSERPVSERTASRRYKHRRGSGLQRGDAKMRHQCGRAEKDAQTVKTLHSDKKSPKIRCRYRNNQIVKYPGIQYNTGVVFLIAEYPFE